MTSSTHIVYMVVSADQEIYTMSILSSVLDSTEIFGQFDILESASPWIRLTLGTRQCVNAMMSSTPCSSLSSLEISIAVSTMERYEKVSGQEGMVAIQSL